MALSSPQSDCLRLFQRNISCIFSSLDPDVLQYIHADQNKLRQILINLLGNAVNFTTIGGIRLSVRRKSGELKKSDVCLLQFEVADTGCGISDEDQIRIFSALYQTDSQRSNRQGTGLGLPISRKFAELMGGTLSVDSEIDRGACFTFDMQLEVAESTEIESNRISRRVVGLVEGQPAFRLLVVEDNDNNRNLLVTLLRSVGFMVREAVNGREAVEIWRKWKPHLIWMDMRMPVMDGFEATTCIRSEIQQTKPKIDTKIIAITASVFEEDRLKVIEHGCNDFVRKPFRERDIFEMIGKHLGVGYTFEQQEDSVSATRSWNLADNKVVASLCSLPENLIARLTEATELSDTSQIDQVITEISAENAPLADILSELAESYVYDTILALIRACKGKH